MRAPIEERFWTKVDRSSNCWVWVGARTKKGYGVIRDECGRVAYAHRLSLEWATGDPLGQMLACHKCDNPPCVNPDHLYPGTKADNTNDSIARGTHWTPFRRNAEADTEK